MQVPAQPDAAKRSHNLLTGCAGGVHPLRNSARSGRVGLCIAHSVEGNIAMSGFRVVYSRGSFGFVSLCDTHEAAIAEARALYGISGVWHVHVEDAEGMKIACDYELCA